jgi:hypothetical protein
LGVPRRRLRVRVRTPVETKSAFQTRSTCLTPHSYSPQAMRESNQLPGQQRELQLRHSGRRRLRRGYGMEVWGRNPACRVHKSDRAARTYS